MHEQVPTVGRTRTTPLPPPLKTLQRSPGYRQSPLRHAVDSPELSATPKSPLAQALSPTRRRLREFENTSVERQLADLLPKWIRTLSAQDVLVGCVGLSIALFIALANAYPEQLVALGVPSRWVDSSEQLDFGAFGEENRAAAQRDLDASNARFKGARGSSSSSSSASDTNSINGNRVVNTGNNNNRDEDYQIRVNTNEPLYPNVQCRNLPELFRYQVFAWESIRGSGLIAGRAVVGGNIDGKFNIGSRVFPQFQSCSSLVDAQVESAVLKIGGLNGKPSNLDGQIYNGFIEGSPRLATGGNGDETPIFLTPGLEDTMDKFQCGIVRSNSREDSSFDAAVLREQMLDTSKKFLELPRNTNSFRYRDRGVVNFYMDLNKKDRIHNFVSNSTWISSSAAFTGNANFMSASTTLIFNFKGTDKVSLSSIDSSIFDFPNKVILHFPDIKQIDIRNMDGYFSILAPKAEIFFSDARVYGSVYAQKLRGDISILNFDNSAEACIPVTEDSTEYGRLHESLDEDSTTTMGVSGSKSSPLSHKKTKKSGQKKKRKMDVIDSILNSWAHDVPLYSNSRVKRSLKVKNEDAGSSNSQKVNKKSSEVAEGDTIMEFISDPQDPEYAYDPRDGSRIKVVTQTIIRTMDKQ